MELLREVGLRWRPHTDSTTKLGQNVSHLCRREKETPSHRYHDVYPTLRWGREVTGHVGTIVCSNRLFDRLRQRHLHGAGCMALHGYTIEALFDELAKNEPMHELMTELAHSTFSGFVLAASARRHGVRRHGPGCAWTPRDCCKRRWSDHPPWMASWNALRTAAWRSMT